MNSGFQNRMYNYEVVPPQGVWDKICIELEDSALQNVFPATLKNIEAPPPPDTWKNIALSLDETLLVNDYSSKLTGIAIPPPNDSWNKIKNSLDSEAIQVIPLKRSIAPILRYAIAAAIIGFIAWGGFNLFNSKAGDTPIAKETNPPSNEYNNSNLNDVTNIIPVENIGIDDITASLEEARNDAALEASKKTYASLDVAVVKSKVKNAASFYFVPETDEPGVRGLDNWQPPTQKTDLSNRYFTLMTPEGNIIRISKKLSDIVGCVAGAEQDQDCLDQLKKWHQKMANPTSTPTSGNFIELLNLANSL